MDDDGHAEFMEEALVTTGDISKRRVLDVLQGCPEHALTLTDSTSK
jgi:hypothetical protein